MNKPRTRLRDYEALKRDQNNLRGLLAHQEVTQDQFYQMWDDLQSQYQDRIFPEDVHSFEGIGELLGFLRDNDLSVTQIGHEMVHGTTATKLGYTVNYCCQALLQEDDTIGYIPFVKILERITIGDYLKITLAPSHLSEGDKATLNAFK